jgi:hypothetical protein
MLSLLTLITLPTPISAENTTTSAGLKRGLSWIGTSHSDSDNAIFSTSDSPITWYKTWGAWPISSSGFSSLDFVPMIHSAENLDEDISTIKSLGGDVEYVLTFNEPDGDTSGGGTNMSPEDAAEAWEDIVGELGGLKISSPATTGSGPGFEWLEKWNESCWEMYEDTGCEFDFVAAHWYGAFEGLAAWLGRLHEAWPEKEIWVTEFALPQPASEEEVEGMMRQSLEWMDETDWVSRYAWFGAFREDDANGWTGEVVSLFDDEGGLTELGSLYMGGNASGFAVGQGSDEGGAVGVRAGWVSVVVGMLVAAGSLF